MSMFRMVANVKSLDKESQMALLRKMVVPYTRKQMDTLEKNTFYSLWEDYRKYNGSHFKVLYEHFEDDTREPFGTETSSAWFNENGEICSDRYFEIQFEDGTSITAEYEEISGFYKKVNGLNV